jgi:hypothetical protein
MKRGWAFGAGAVLAVHATWFGLIFLESRADWFMAAIVVMLFVVMNAAGLGAFITAMTAPRRGFLLGLTHAPLTACLALASNLLLAATGTQVDFSGFRGNLGLFAISLAYGLFVCVIGGAIGLWMRRRNGSAFRNGAPVPEVPARLQEPFISDPAAPAPGPAPPAGHI